MFRFWNSIGKWWDKTQPAFWRRMKSGYRAAIIILVLVLLWVGSGFVLGSGGDHAQVDNAAAKPNDIPSVQVRTVTASTPMDRNVTLSQPGTARVAANQASFIPSR